MPFTLVRDDLLHIRADALVVPDSCNLDMGGGVSLAVARAAGEEALRAAAAVCAPVEPGSAVVLPAGELAHANGDVNEDGALAVSEDGLSAVCGDGAATTDSGVKMLVFAVGPVWRDGNSGEALCLRMAYRNALAAACKAGARSVALPLISAGSFGFPAGEALDVAVQEIRSFVEDVDVDVTLTLFGHDALAEGRRRFPDLAEFIDDEYVCCLGFDPMTGMPIRELRNGSRDSAFARREYAPSASMPAASMPAPSSPAASMPAPSAPEACMPAPVSMECASVEKNAKPKASKKGGVAGLFKAMRAQVSDLGEALADDEPSIASFGECHAERRAEPVIGESLEQWLKKRDESFSDSLLNMIDQRGLTDAQVYRRANLSKQVFNKIKNVPTYHPGKPTVLALCIALELDLPTTREMLGRAGFALNHNDLFDLIVEYHIVRGIYDHFVINEALFSFDQQLLGGK